MNKVKMNKRTQQTVALITSFLLLVTSFSGFSPSSIHAQNLTEKDNVISMQQQTAQTAADKIDDTVYKAARDETFVDVLIELQEQVDTAEIAAGATENLTSATAFQEKMAARYAVVDALQQTAESSQQPILKYLKQEQEAGNVKRVKSFYIMNVVHVEATMEVIEQLSYRSDITSIKKNERIEMEFPIPDDSSDQGLTENGTAHGPPDATADPTVEWNIERIGAPAVWEAFGVEGAGVVVGVIDTGVHWTHEALQQNWRGYNPEDPDNPDPFGNWYDAVEGGEMPYDLEGVPHGTHVMGTILGQDPAGEHKIGVAPQAQWIAAKAFDYEGGLDSWLLAAGEYMLAPEGDPGLAPDIINNSWGGWPGVDEFYRPMVEAWRDAGIVPVFAAGNDGPGEKTVTPPADYPESYAVAATDINDRAAPFSGRGPSHYDGEQKPDISAPGVNIRSSVPDGYQSGWNGTSMAAPHIAGTAALLLSADASLSVDEIEALLNETASPLTDDQYKEVPNDGYGYGLVSAFDAITVMTDGASYIEGHVLTEGTDATPPVIEHDPYQLAYRGIDLPVQASVTDDVAITRAEIWVSLPDRNYDIVIPMEKQAGDHKEAEYFAYIPWMFIEEPGFEYHIRAYDYGRNFGETDRFEVDVQFGVVPNEYSEDFSEYPHGWLFDGDWEWGEPTDGPDPVKGDKLMATNLNGAYSNHSNSRVLLPSLDLREVENASLHLQHWYSFIGGFDYGYVAVSTDYGQNWDVVKEVTGAQTDWDYLTVNLNEYAGSSDPVLVTLQFLSDEMFTDLGWYVDDVYLSGNDFDPPGIPQHLTAETNSGGVHLSWEGPDDRDLAGYYMYRKTDGEDEFEQIGRTSKPKYTDTNVENGTQYEYAVSAYDDNGNESELSDPISVVAEEVIPLYYSDFEQDDGGFNDGGWNNSWAWGEPTSGPQEAYSGTNVWATNLDGKANESEESFILSPFIDLRDVDDAQVQFAAWYDLGGTGLAAVQVSDETGGWVGLQYYSDVDDEWTMEQVSLQEHVGRKVQLRFAFYSFNEEEGFYLDDVMVTAGSSRAEQTGSRDDRAEAIDPEVRKHFEQDWAGEEDSAARPFTSSEQVEQDNMIPDLYDAVRHAAEPEMQLRLDEDQYEYYRSDDSELLSTGGLPVEGTVTVLESSRTVRTNPADGSYRLLHPPSEEGETWTLRAEAYGFYPQEAEVALGSEETVQQNFMLEPIPRGTVQGTIVDSLSGLPVEQATIRVVEDQRVPTTQSDAEGFFELTDVLQGEYTVRVSAANYYVQTVEVDVQGGEITSVQIELKPFIGYDEELAYDDGTAEDAWAFFQPGNGWAVRMTPEENALVKGASVYLWDESFPDPGGNEFAIAVFDTDENGEPGDMLIESVPAEGERGAWNYVDLSAHSVVTDRDFFVVMMQTDVLESSPAIGTDYSSSYAGRSYTYEFGEMIDSDGFYGNLMIRAEVSYELSAPVITEPADETYTNEDTIEVSGTVKTDSEVTIYNNGEEAAVVQAENKQFTASVALTEGANALYAVAEIESGASDPSQTVTVIQDLTAPSLHVASPEDGMITNGEVITVQGFAYDEYLEGVYVNDKAVDVQEDGSYSTRIIVEEGENVIGIQARDLAGNETTEERTVIVDLSAPVMDNIQPAEDVHVSPGDEVTVSFSSDAKGGTASFTVNLPSGSTSAQDAALSAADASSVAENASDGSIKMEEVKPGQYVGTWAAPDIDLEGAIVSIEHKDQAGNRATAVAEGKITITSGKDTEKGKKDKKGKEKD